METRGETINKDAANLASQPTNQPSIHVAATHGPEAALNAWQST